MADQQGNRAINLAPNQARQLLNQYAVEKKAAEAAGLDTPIGQSHMQKAEKIRNILYTYSKKQKQAQQQQQAQAQQQQQQQIPIAKPLQSSGIDIKQEPSLQGMNSQQQLHMKKQEILSKYQQVMQMAEKFKSSLVIIQQRKNEPDLDAKTVAYYAEKEKEMVMRIENCKKVTQQIATQLKIASQQSNNAGSPGSPIQSPGSTGIINRTRSANSIQQQSDGMDQQQMKRQKLDDGPSSFTRSSTTGNMSSLLDDKSKFDNMNIPDNLRINNTDFNNSRINNRASMLGGNAIYAPGLTMPPMSKGQIFNYDGEQVLNKRKLKELVSSIAAEKGDIDLGIDGDVEDLLLDLADEFVQNVTTFAAKLARHRHSDNLDVRDIQLPLERTWNIRIPGYSIDEIRMVKKFAPNQSHQSKLNGVNINKSVNKNS